jgi:hypothetical protein
MGHSYRAWFSQGKVNVQQPRIYENGRYQLAKAWRDIHPYDMVKVTADEQEYTVPAFMLTTDRNYITGQKTGLETLWGGLQGEFNENPTGEEIVIDMLINFIPGVGLLCDARDIIACLDKICNKGKHNDVWVWISLVLIAIGCIPYAGDVVKGILKSIIKGADDVAIKLIKTFFSSDDIVKNLDELLIKFQGMIPAIQEQITKWATDAAASGKINSAVFIDAAGRMFHEAVTKIDDAIVGLRNKLDGDAAKLLDEAPGVDHVQQIANDAVEEVNKIADDVIDESADILASAPNRAQLEGILKKPVDKNTLKEAGYSIDINGRIKRLSGNVEKGYPKIYVNPETRVIELAPIKRAGDIASSAKLRKNMIAHKIEVPKYLDGEEIPNAAHHIVSGGDMRADKARDILDRFGIKINEAENGVFLPTVQGPGVVGTYHPSLNTKAYNEKVHELLRKATSKENAIEILKDIGEQLANGTFM